MRDNRMIWTNNEYCNGPSLKLWLYLKSSEEESKCLETEQIHQKLISTEENLFEAGGGEKMSLCFVPFFETTTTGILSRARTKTGLCCSLGEYYRQWRRRRASDKKVAQPHTWGEKMRDWGVAKCLKMLFSCNQLLEQYTSMEIGEKQKIWRKEQVLQFVEGRKNPGDVYCQRHLLTSIFTPGGHIESMIRHKSCKSMFHDPRMNTTWNHDKTEFSFIFKVSFSAYLFFLFITLTKTFSSRVLALQQIIVCFKTPGKFVYVKKLHLMCVRKKDTR